VNTLTPEENLIAAVARSTCFAYRVDPADVPETDVQLYVDELIALYRRKPDALLALKPGDKPDTVAGSVRFCAEQLQDAAPQHASKLRAALGNAQ
jgi:hypothetical protein